jgi:hypothetical protein
VLLWGERHHRHFAAQIVHDDRLDVNINLEQQSIASSQLLWSRLPDGMTKKQTIPGNLATPFTKECNHDRPILLHDGTCHG